MNEELDLSNAVEMLKEMLGSDDGKKQIENIVSQFGGNADNDNGVNAADMEMLLKIKKIMSAANSGENTRQTEFLRSLAPLLGPSRRRRIDNAVRLMNMSNIINVMKEMG